MNGLHDLLDKLKKLEEATAAPTEFKPQYYHERNIGSIMPVMMTDPGVFWVEVSATNDPEMGGRRGMGAGGKTIQRLYGDPNARGITAVGSVDGKLVNGNPVPFGPGETWKTDLDSLAQTRQSIAATNASLAAPNKEYDAAVASLKDPFKGAKLTSANPLPPVSTSASTSATDNTSSALNNNNGSVQVGDVSQTAVVGVPTEITTNLARVKQIITAISEGIRFKSRIGHALLESFDLKLNEDAASDLAELNKIWPVCVNWAKDPANASNPVAKEIETLAPQVTTWQGKAQSNTRIGTGGTASSATDGTSSALNNNNGSGSTSRVPPENAARDAWNKVTGARYKNDTIGPGSRDVPPDTRVADLQKKLGITPVTGVFGEAEKKAVMAIQEKAGLKPVDGKYGPATKEAHEKSLALAQPEKEVPVVTPNKTVTDKTVTDKTVTDKTVTDKTASTTIKVRKGDTLTSIAKSCTPPITREDLIKANPGIDPTKQLMIDQTINLPPGTKAGILPADSAPKAAEVTPKITDVPPMPNLPEPPPPKRETGVIGTLTDDPTYQNWLRKNVKNPKADDLYWVNGERYEATLRRGRLTWIKDQPFGNAERTAQLRNYTGPDSEADAFAKEQQKIWSAAQQARIQGKVKESTGFANEELNRILSLVHHR
jgi:hypothetical protein